MNSKMNKHHLCSRDECTGCYACVNRCPKEAIEMKIDKDGAIRPFIDEKKCVNCGLCDKVCPALNHVELNTPKKVYAAYAEEDIRVKSASGGVATMIAKKFIRQGGVVYGASQTRELFVEHIRIDSEEDLARIQGTKYVHSHVGNTIKNIQSDIKIGKKVLFIGSPCEVAGIKNSFPNEDALYCIDLICHGAPSWKTLSDCMRRESKCNSFEDKSITFRDADGYNIKIRNKDNKIVYRGNLKNSQYYNGFMEGYIFRNNCYSCRYADKERAGDITLGDFWGLNTDKDFDGDTKKGINVVLVNTERGNDLFSLMGDDILSWERSLDEAVAGNGQLRHPSGDSINHKIFSILTRYMSADKAIIFCNIKKSIKLSSRSFLKNSGMGHIVIKLFPQLKRRL